MESYYLVLGVICAVFCGGMAVSKNRNGLGWAVLGFFTSVLALVAIAGIPALARKSESQGKQLLDEQLLSHIYIACGLLLSQQVGEMKHGTCPACNHRVVFGLPTCPFCRQKLGLVKMG